jgi:hypothetical protein
MGPVAFWESVCLSATERTLPVLLAAIYASSSVTVRSRLRGFSICAAVLRALAVLTPFPRLQCIA